MRRTLTGLLCLIVIAVHARAQTPAPAPDPRAEPFVASWLAARDDVGRDAVLHDFAPVKPIFFTLADIGEALERKGDFAASRSHLGACYEAAVRLRDDLSSSICLQTIGVVDRLEGKYEGAEEHYTRALEYARRPGATIRIPIILNNLANIYASQSRFTEALEMLQASIDYDESEGARLNTSAYQNMGSIYGQMGDMTRSLQYFLKAQSLYEEKADENRLALVHHNIGFLHMIQANYAAAGPEFETAVGLATKVGDKTHLALIYGDMGRMLGLEGKPKEALAALNRSLELSRGMGFKAAYVNAVLNMAGFETDNRDYAAAGAHFHEALQVAEQLKDVQNQGAALRGLSLITRMNKDYRGALEYAADALKRIEPIGDRNGQWQSEALAGMAWRGLGDAAQARGSFQRAIALIEQQRGLVAGGEIEKQLFFEQAVFPYRELALLEAESGNSLAALQAAERTRARVLLDVIESGPNLVDRLMSDEERAEEKKLRARIAVANLRTGTARDREAGWRAYQSFLATLYVRNPQLRTWRGDSPVISADELSSLVPDTKTVLVEFLGGQDETLLFTVTRDNGKIAIRTHHLPIGRAALSRLTGRYRTQIEGRDPAFRATSKEIYDSMLKPAAAQLRAHTRVCIVADGPLGELPFQSLPSPGGGGYWIQQATISIAPSIGFLRDRGTVSQSSEPGFGRDLVAFSGTAELDDQVRRIAALYEPGRTIVRVAGEAAEAAFRNDAVDGRVLHLAAHGVVDRQNAMRSRIVLSQPDTKASVASQASEDGLLEAWEFMRMNLHADLAILSACESGRGRVAEGEGLMGLTWSLFVAGVRTTVVSQWQVEAGSTTELMVSLHQHLRRGEKPAEALRGAILALMKDERYRHPMYWSAFVVAGL